MPGNGNNVYALVDCQGADASTTFTDESLGGSTHTVTAAGDAQVDTGITDAWGGNDGCLMVDGDGDHLALTVDTGDFAFPDEFGIDTWIRPNAINTNDVIFGNGYTSGGYMLYLNVDGNIGCLNQLGWVMTARAHGLSANTWAHVAIMRDQGNIRVYLDGVHFYSGAYTTALNSIGTFYYGHDPDWASAAFAGYMQELRVINGSCPIRSAGDPLYIASGDHTDGFTPPTAKYAALASEPVIGLLPRVARPINRTNPFDLVW
jgi:hypothetical protein